MTQDELERLALAHAEGAAFSVHGNTEQATVHALLANTYATLATLESARTLFSPCEKVCCKEQQ